MHHRSPKVFLLGNQKSGTTAIASLLAHYGKFSTTLDIPEFWEKEREIHAGRLTLRAFVESNPHRFSTQLVKEPCLTFLCEELLRLFPDAKCLFVIRHPADNIRSILDRFKAPGNLDHLEIKGNLHKAWKDVFDGTLQNISHGHFITRLAMRWVIAAETYLRHKDKMVLVRYEDFMKDKYGTIRDAAEMLEIRKEQEIDHVLDVQYQPRGISRGIPWLEFYGEKNLAIIKEICGPRLEDFDYRI